MEEAGGMSRAANGLLSKRENRKVCYFEHGSHPAADTDPLPNFGFHLSSLKAIID